MSEATDMLEWQMQAARVATPVREYRFHPVRRWRFDLAWPDRLLALEVDGGGWVQGRHGRGQGIEDDCEKVSTAVALGWSVLRVTPRHIASGEALKWAEAALKVRP